MIAAEIALRDASTDEWLMPAESEAEVAPVAPAPAVAAEVVRPGPAVLESDTWSEDSAGESHAEAYHGRRRAPAPAARLWLVIGLVLVGLGAAVSVPLALRSSPPAAAASPTAEGEAPLTEPTAARARPSGTSSPAASPTTSPSPKPAPPARPPSPPTPPSSPTAPPFVPLSMEAEAAARGGSATPRAVAGASNGSVVGTLGDRDGGGAENDGWVRFSATAPAAGPYAIAIFFVFSDGANRNAHVEVNDRLQPWSPCRVRPAPAPEDDHRDAGRGREHHRVRKSECGGAEYRQDRDQQAVTATVTTAARFCRGARLELRRHR